MKKLYSLLSATFIIIFIASCATIITGTDQTLTFNSEPDGAYVTIAGRVVGQTPLVVEIDKGKNQSLTFEKKGYKTFKTQLSTSMNPWFWGNIIIGGLLGSTTDGVSGAIHEFAPDQYFITLTPDTPLGISTSKPRKIKELLVAFGAEIRLELASGGGEKTDAILALLGIGDSEKPTTLAVLQKLSLQNKNDLDFAKGIIEFYDVK